MRSTRTVLAAAAAAALALSLPAAASAASAPPPPQEWSTQLGAPFSIALDGTRVYVADGATGTIGQLQPDGQIAPVVEGIPGLTGLAIRGASMAWGSSVEDGSTEPPVILESGLNIRGPKGTTVYADLHAYEVANNPDAASTYGITDPNPCVVEATGGAPLSYTGLVDAHAYNVASWKGEWLVADAGANTVMRVTDSGRISTLAVLPPVPVTLTAETAGMLGLPACAAGDTYYVEPVPTGITVGSGNTIYVTTLPGFPGESASQGALWQVDASSGTVTQLVSGLSGPTSAAVKGKDVYVAELFGAGVTKVTDGAASPYAALNGALSVAVASNGTVWAATMDLTGGPGTIVSIAKGKVHVNGNIVR
ncbi:ScyD/ScyE family protein [Microbacterium abyssi]|uniref:ScyD/ScyE family protein n=1 Tax=Microbacterium abyssi TaxID=2782166 RepID=UPI00188723FD|nr:ScyD/ScyE family protein [Microbacterium sp. A18JL241]